MSEMIGPYRVEGRLGVGGMGEVYKAFDDRLDRWVAIKRIRPDKETAGDHRERFQREARATARLNHSSIVHLYDIFQDGDSDCIVMEYVEGRTLDKLLLEGELTPLKVATLGEEIASGLAEAHAKGILHRDLKVENIIVTPEGHAKILDFGLAKPMLRGDLDAGLTGKGQLVGTSRAMAPEYVSGEQVDHRSDLFSLGVLLYESSTGHSPFKSHNTLATLKQVMLYRQTPAQQLNPQLPGELSELIDRLLAKDPADRPYQAEDVARELRGIVGQLSSDTVPRPSSGAVLTDGSFLTQTATATSLDLLSRRRWVVLAVVMAAVLGTAVLLRWLSPEPKDTPAAKPPEETLNIEERDRIVVGHFENRTGETKLDDSVNYAFRVGLEQSRYAHIMSDDQIREALQRMERDPDTAIVDRALGVELCKREGAKALVTGSIVKIGQSYTLNANIIDPQTWVSTFSTNTIVESQDGIVAALDELTREIRNNLGESLAAIEATTRLEKVTTRDLEALRAYSIGVRKLATDDSGEAAKELFRRALEIDPGFAMAHAKLASIYINKERSYSEALRHLDRALDLSDRLTGYEELYVEGWVARLRGTPEEVVQVWSLMSSLYPDQFVGHRNVGMAYFFLFNQFDKAAVNFENAVRVATDPQTRSRLYLNLGYCQLALGQNDEALASLDNVGAGWSLHAEYQLAVADYAKAQALLEGEDAAASPGDRLTAAGLWMQFAVDQGDFERAETAVRATHQLARELGRDDLELGAALTAIAVEERSGSEAEFLDVVSLGIDTAERILLLELERLDQQKTTTLGGLHRLPVRMLALMGKLSSRNAVLDQAELIHERIRPLVEERGLPIWIALSKMLEAEMLAARGNHATAIARLREAISYADLFQVHESIARIQWAAGNEAAAVSEYAWMVANRGRAVVECYEGCQPANLIDWNLAFYQLARLHDEAGNGERAADYYRQFLDRWPEAAGVPEWQAAERRLAELQPAGGD